MLKRPAATQKIHIAFIFVVLRLVVTFYKPSLADEIAGREKQQGPMDCGWAGVQVGQMTGPIADSLGLVRSYGAIFDRPEPGGPAAKARIEAGDVLTAINGMPLEKASDFAEIVARWAPGSVVYLNTWRDGQLMPRTLTLGSAQCPNQSSEGSLAISTPTATPAAAFITSQLGQRGPLLLRGIVQLIGQSIQLQTEVNSTLNALGKTVDEVTCTGDQFPEQWNNLAGIRVAPYACDFTNRWLLIDATVTVSGSNGKVYDSITPAAIENADVVAERNPIWVWTGKNQTGAHSGDWRK